MDKQTLDNFSQQMLNQAIQGINEATANQQAEVNYWKAKAQAFSRKYQACLHCQSEKNYLPEPMACQSCHQRITKQRCQGCYTHFPSQELKSKEGYWWCKSCQPSAGFSEKEINHA